MMRLLLFNGIHGFPLEGIPSEKENLLESLATADLAELQQSSVLVYGDFKNAEEAYIRMHSICHTGDIFGSQAL